MCIYIYIYTFSHSASSFPIAAWLCLVDASFPYSLSEDRIYNLFEALLFLNNVVSRTNSYSTFAHPCMLFVFLPIWQSTLCPHHSVLGEVI